MDTEKRIEACTVCAKRIMARMRKFNNTLEFNELVNEGYAYAKYVDSEDELLKSIYLYMLNFACKHKDLEREREYVRRLLSRRSNGIDLDSLIDLKEAFEDLTIEEIEVLHDYFQDGLTFAEMAEKRELAQGNAGSSFWKMSSILNKLKYRLRRRK